VTTPLTIAPPSCNGPGNDGWGLTAECDPAAGPNIVTLHFTYPSDLGISPDITGIAAGTIPGMLSCFSSGSGMTCAIDISLAPRGPLTMTFIGPAPDYAPIYHTFTEYDSIVPLSCQGGSTNGWSVRDAQCSEFGGGVFMNIFYPPDLAPFTYLSVTAGSITFTCVDIRTSTPYRLACGGGTTFSPAPLQVTYTSGGVTNTITIPDWPTLAPRFCPTPVPPLNCSQYTNEITCNANPPCSWKKTEGICSGP
jgi:hypothetical protein